MRGRFRRSVPSENGQAMIEFMFATFFAIFIILWMVEFMMMIYSYNVLANAAKEGVRYAEVHGCGSSLCSGTCTTACPDTTGANVVTQVKNYAQLTFHDISGITVNVTYPDSSALSPSRVRVVVQYPYIPYFPSFVLPSNGSVLTPGMPTINAVAEGRIVN